MYLVITDVHYHSSTVLLLLYCDMHVLLVFVHVSTIVIVLELHVELWRRCFIITMHG